MRTYSPLFDAKLDAFMAVLRRSPDGTMRLDAEQYRDLADLGLSRAEVGRIVDRLAVGSDVKLATTGGTVLVRLADWQRATTKEVNRN